MSDEDESVEHLDRIIQGIESNPLNSSVSSKQPLESNSIARFTIHSDYQPAGDQQSAIEEILSQLENGQERCILLGITGSGKTFAMAHIIERLQMPTILLSHNKTLARQLWQEMSTLFPGNAVEYFVSHYDYYQPEAYLPGRDLYIDKELQMNERIEQERFSTVASLVSRQDVIAVCTVSAIYGLNPPETFLQHHLRLVVGQEIEPQEVVKDLVALHYSRVSGSEFKRGDMRLRGDVLDVWMPSRDDPLRIRFGLDGIEGIQVCEAISWQPLDQIEEAWIHPKMFYITSPERFIQAVGDIEDEMESTVVNFEDDGRDIEAHRIEQRTRFDLELLTEIGSCKGIENYSRHFDGRKPGERPYCLLDFMAACAETQSGDASRYLVLMDESHVTLPQLGGMHGGDRARKENLVNHGFRLPSAFDNRPLRIDEFQDLVPRMLYVSATPGERELRHLAEVTGQEVPIGLQYAPGGGGAIAAGLKKPANVRSAMLGASLGEIEGVVQMEIRPTGLLDPKIEVRPTEGQVQDLLDEINILVERDERILVTVLTIKFAEEVAAYLKRMGVKAHHLHSELGTIERSEVIKALRIGHIDVIVGINLLREGLDLPEVSLVAIFDADREGFLRNERSLLQTIGRASRNENGRVILYADSVSPGMESAISQTLQRRQRQEAHNEREGITPTTIQKAKPVMGEESEALLAGTAGRGSRGGKRLVGARVGGRSGASDKDPVKRFGLGAGLWAPSAESLESANQSTPSEAQESAPTMLNESGEWLEATEFFESDSVLANVSPPAWVRAAGESLVTGVDIPDGQTTDTAASLISRLQREMKFAAARLEFERAAALRDRIFQLENEKTN